ncbi:hypothetical protein ACFL6E_07680 [Candidatus Neomarinimicrobiota bacterium]
MKHLLATLIITSTLFAQEFSEQEQAAIDSVGQVQTSSIATKLDNDLIETIIRTPVKGFWISGNVGIAVAESIGSGYSIGMTYQINNTVITIREEVANLSIDLISSSAIALMDYAILFGRRFNNPEGFIVASSGVSLLIGNKKEADISLIYPVFAPHGGGIPFRTIGVPLELQVIRVFGSNFGIGYNLYVNLNPESTYLSAMLSLNFGKLKY